MSNKQHFFSMHFVSVGTILYSLKNKFGSAIKLLKVSHSISVWNDLHQYF